MDITKPIEENENSKTEICGTKEQLKKGACGNTKVYYEKNKARLKEGGVIYPNILNGK
jgi:hypothetical protein